jgi:hypothetical protein
VATRYKGRIKSYQIWNEPQSRVFWYPDGFITLGTMTRRAHDIIKAIDPLARVVAAPVLPRPSSGGIKRGAKYLTQLKARDWPVDVFTLHAYPETGYGVARVAWMIDQMRSALLALKAPAKPLWITEINYNLMHGELLIAQQVALVKGTQRVAGDCNIPRVYWYAMDHTNPQLLGVTFHQDSTTLSLLV